MNKKEILEKYGVSLYLRDGKWYWMIKSDSHETMEAAAANAAKTFEDLSANRMCGGTIPAPHD